MRADDPGSFTRTEPSHDDLHSSRRRGQSVVCLRVDDITAVYARLRKAGMSFWADPSLGPTGNVAVYGRDPFGNLIELTQFADATG